MKECPKCGTLYTDLTLAYCLSDGTPLVIQTSGEKTEKFTNADIVTEQFQAQDIYKTSDDETVIKTKPTNLPTNETVIQTNKDPQKKGVSPIWIIATFGLLGIILIGGVSFWVFSDKLFQDKDVVSDTNSNSNSAFARSLENTSKPTQKPTSKPTETSTPKPETYRVTNVKSNDVLYIRPQAGNLKVFIGKIPPNGRGIKIIGGSKKVGKSRWILISYEGKRGWVNSKFISKE